MRRPIKAHLVNWLNRPVYRSKPVTHAILNLDLNSTSFRSNRSSKPLQEGGGLTGPVGIINPGLTWLIYSAVNSIMCGHFVAEI